MIVLGLTGSIGMGKSVTARLFAEEGAAVCDADRLVHDLYDVGGRAVGPVGAAFPGVAVEGKIDREALAARVLGQPEALARLEALVHPLVAEERAAFLAKARADGGDVAVLDIPLLFETGAHEQVDAVVVVSAPLHIQRERVLARPGMTQAKLDAILGRQMSDQAKREKADFVVDADQGVEHARGQVRRILAAVRDPAFKPRRTLASGGEASH